MRSWQRTAPRLNPRGSPQRANLSEDVLPRTLHQHALLLALARAIHNSGKRAAGPFLAINCQAIPRDLVLGEFLGYEQGAFNATTSGGQPSKFELAESGTLFLDQIDALPLDMQTVLVRVIPVDVRVMASTESDLERRMEI